MQKNKEESSWDGFAGDLFRRAYSFGLSACQLAHVATAIAVVRQDSDVERSAFSGAHSPAIWFLAGFAFELFLKSAIVAAGANEAEIRAIGHDLAKTLEKAEQHGLELKDSTRFSIDVANRAHNGSGDNRFFFRYGGGESADVETVDAMMTSLRDLLTQTASLVDHPEASFETFLLPFQTIRKS